MKRIPSEENCDHCPAFPEKECLNENVVILSSFSPGQKGIVFQACGDPDFRLRLMEMGFVKGIEHVAGNFRDIHYRHIGWIYRLAKLEKIQVRQKWPVGFYRRLRIMQGEGRKPVWSAKCDSAGPDGPC